MKFTRSGMPSPLRDVIDGKNANRKLKMPNEKKSKELVEVENQISQDELADLGQAERDLGGDIVGQPLKFAKGKWKKGFGKEDEAPVTESAPFIVDMRSYARGWIKWVDRLPVHKLIGRPIDKYPFPERRAFGDLDKTKWPRDKNGAQTDPWQEVHTIVLKDTDAAEGEELCTYQTQSVGGRKAIAKLINTFRRDVRKFPGLMPVVLLQSHTYYSQDYGDIAAPVLKVVDWKPFGNDASPPGAPIETAPMIPVPETKALPAVDAEFVGTADHDDDERDPDDEIPF